MVEDHIDEFDHVKDYQTRGVEIIIALKEGVAILITRATENNDDDEGAKFLEKDGSQATRLIAKDVKAKTCRVGKITEVLFHGQLLYLFLGYQGHLQEAIAIINLQLIFHPLKMFFYHLEVEFGGIQCDRMRHIQDFKNEVEDTHRIMYACLARFARESGDVFIERQLVYLYMAKQNKKLHDIAHLHILLMYEGRTTLAQTFAMVEQLDRRLCVEELRRLPTTMTTSVNQSNVSITSPNKGQGNIKPLRQVSMVADVDVEGNTPWRCWKCGNIGYEKKHCSGQLYSEGQYVFKKTKQDKGKMAGVPSKCTYAQCGRIGHTEA